MSHITETNDTKAYLNSLPEPLPQDWQHFPKANSLALINGPRFDFRSNQQYQMDATEWAAAKDDPAKMAPIVEWFMSDHYRYQVPRILTLERYYNGDNDILYWNSQKPLNRADNRIPSGLPHYATDILDGYEFGKPLTYGYSNPQNKADDGSQLLGLINQFNQDNDMDIHEKETGKQAMITGRAYELMYVKPDSHDVAVRQIDPANAFIVYDTTLAMHSLFGVRYYLTRYMDKESYFCEVYTNTAVFYYKIDADPSGTMTFDHAEQHFFGDIPMTEFDFNRERAGQWERKLNTVDAIDKVNSEMANSEEDFNNATLVINGDIEVPKQDPNDSTPIYFRKLEQVNRKSAILFLKPSVIKNNIGQGPTVVQTNAQYLTKQLDANGWKIHIDHLIDEFHKETYSPNMNDEQFAGQQSGEAMKYKLLGTDQERAIFESKYTKGIMRRLRVLMNYWSFIEQVADADTINNVKVTFNPNLPKLDSETIANVSTLSATNAFSKQTLREKAEDFTGVTADQEKQRYDAEQKQTMQQNMALFNGGENNDDNQNNGETSNPPVNAARRPNQQPTT